MILSSHGIIGSQIVQFTGVLLDDYPNAAAAYSLRLLRKAYTGSAIRVRRASDNTELDIAFVNNELDTATLTSFCSGTNGFVKTWYDQSGNGYDATQATAANQPQIVSGGSVILENGKPSVQFDGSNDNLNTAPFTMGASFSVFSAFNLTSTTGFRDLISHNFVSSGNAFLTQGRWILVRTGATAQDWAFGDAVLIGAGSTSTRNPRFVSSGNIFIANTQHLLSGILSSSTSQIWKNGTAATAKVQKTSSISSETGKVYIGSSEIFDQFQGRIQEVFIYDTDQSTNRTGIETNINDFYSIY